MRNEAGWVLEAYQRRTWLLNCPLGITRRSKTYRNRWIGIPVPPTTWANKEIKGIVSNEAGWDVLRGMNLTANLHARIEASGLTPERVEALWGKIPELRHVGRAYCRTTEKGEALILLVSYIPIEPSRRKGLAWDLWLDGDFVRRVEVTPQWWIASREGIWALEIPDELLSEAG